VDEDREKRLQAWLADRGVEGSRRIVRETNGVILVSKFAAGFAARLHDAVERVPEMFDASVFNQHSASRPGLVRVEAWRVGLEGLLAEVGLGRGLDREQIAEVQAGVDSVAALLDSILWSGPVVGIAWAASEAERAAFADAQAKMSDESSIFTRFYGEFEGFRVENHCPGAQVARRLFAQAWEICTAD
jgi:hypothetical protein